MKKIIIKKIKYNNFFNLGAKMFHFLKYKNSLFFKF